MTDCPENITMQKCNVPTINVGLIFYKQNIISVFFFSVNTLFNSVVLHL